MKIGICCAPTYEEDKIISACKESKIDFEIIDILSDNWLENCTDDIDGYILRPPCNYQELKTIFDERAYFINKILHKSIYPNLDEVYTYENKRNMSLYMSKFGLPHAKTNIFTTKKEAVEAIDKLKFPIVMKSNIGAAGSGVLVVRNVRAYKKLINRIFGRFSSELSFGLTPWVAKSGLKIPRYGKAQKHYALVQEYVSIKWEWRMIRIGDSYFGHQKLLGSNKFASGSQLVGWENPPLELLQLLRDYTNKMNMRCMVLDIFESEDGQYYVNEMQAIIGAYRPYQMKVNGKTGRYIYANEGFHFEEGTFCENACWNLRLKDFIKELEGTK